MASQLENDLAEWLATVASGLQDTIQERPRSTIVPRIRRESANERALELLRSLSGRDAGDPLPELVLGEEIASGGMGRIRVADQVSLGREVVVKTLRPELTNDFGATLELLREAWVTGALEHPNIMPVYNIALDADGAPLIVLKRIEGVTWSELMTDEDTVRERYGAVDMLEWNLEILLRVLDALRFAHSRAIIHRDVKPENVMVGEFGEVYLVDWGIAVSLVDDPSGRLPHVSTVTGVVAGTPCYMAPEMLGDAQDVRTDVYLAGAVLYEVIVGRTPHPGTSVLEVLTNVAIGEPTLPDDVPAELAAICLRALARKPEERFSSVEEMRTALVQFVSHRGSTKLSDRARESHVKLRAELARETASIEEKREVVYRLLGECRFGFGAALSAWSENGAAEKGLVEALASVARFELNKGNPGAADTLLSELTDPPAELRDSIDKALAKHDEVRRRYAELADDADVRVGNRTRMILTLVLGVVWTVTPLIAYFLDEKTQMASRAGAYERTLILTLGVFLFLVGLAGATREAIIRSRVNRLLAATILVAITSQAVLLIGCWMLGLEPIVAQTLMPLLWAFGALVLAFLELRAALPLALGYVAAFLLSASFPRYRFLFMAGANLVVMINAMLIWARFARLGAAGRNDPPD